MAETKRDRFHQLQQEKTSKLQELEALKAERSQAKIDGTAFEKASAISELESDLAVIDGAIAEVDRQANIEEAQERASIKAEGLKKVDKRIENLIDTFVHTSGAAQEAMKEVVAVLESLHIQAAEINRLVSAYGGEHTGTIPVVTDANVAHRMSERFERHLSKLGVNGYGRMTWAPTHPIIEDWASQDRNLLEHGLSVARRQIAAAIKELEAEATAV